MNIHSYRYGDRVQNLKSGKCMKSESKLLSLVTNAGQPWKENAAQVFCNEKVSLEL